jgi:hypothetical protein
MQKALIVLSFVSMGLVMVTRSNAQVPQGYRSMSLNIAGRTVTCSSAGSPVTWIADYALNDGGHTMPGFTVIAYKPTVLQSMPGPLQLWAMGHECGHAFNRTANETEADCWSITTGIRQGWFKPEDFDDLVQLFQNNPGDLNHPPGVVRIADMKTCMDRTTGQAGHQQSATSQSNNSAVTDPEASACARTDATIYDVQWHKNVADPTVTYKYGYENTCDQPINCTIKVAVGNNPRSHGTSDYDEWNQTDQKVRSLSIPENETRAVSGTLTWDAQHTPDTMPVLRRSSQREDDDDWKIGCAFVSAPK